MLYVKQSLQCFYHYIPETYPQNDFFSIFYKRFLHYRQTENISLIAETFLISLRFTLRSACLLYSQRIGQKIIRRLWKRHVNSRNPYWTLRKRLFILLPFFNRFTRSLSIVFIIGDIEVIRTSFKGIPQSLCSSIKFQSYNRISHREFVGGLEVEEPSETPESTFLNYKSEDKLLDQR